MVPGARVKIGLPRIGAGLALAGALALCAALAGCGRDNANAAPAPAKAPVTTITALVWAPDWPREMQQIAAEFSRQNPGIRVDLEFMIGDSVEANLKPKVASNQLPDIISVNPNAYAVTLAEQGILAELGQSAAWNNMLDRLKPDWTTPGNRHYGIAGGVAATLIYYNKSLFERAGVTALPTDFEQFLALCEQLKRAGIAPIMWNGGFPNTLANGPFSFGFANHVVARTPNWKRKIADGSLALDTPEGAAIFSEIKLIAQRGYAQPDYMRAGYDEGIALFTEGKTAMAFHGTWASGMLMHGKGFQTGVFVPPWNARGAPVVPVIGSETGFAVCETPNKKAAMLFLEFLFGPGFAIQQNKRHNIAPLKQAPGQLAGDAQIGAYIERVGKAPLAASPYYSFLPAGTIEMLHPLLQDVLQDKVTPRQAARALEQSIKREARL